MTTIEEIVAVFGDPVAAKIDKADGVVDLNEVRQRDDAATHVERARGHVLMSPHPLLDVSAY